MKVQPNIVTISTHVPAGHAQAFRDCPVCGSTQPRRQVGMVQSDPPIGLLRCSHCRAVSASHLPAPAFLADYYRNVFANLYSPYNQGHEHDITISDPRRFVRHLLRDLAVAAPAAGRRLRIIDFGGGDGTLSLMLARQLAVGSGADIVVVDFGTKVAASPTPDIAITKVATLDGVVDPADIVLASASIEHVGHAEPVIRKLLSLLKPGGWFYARTPYIVPLKRLVPSIDIGYPAHVHDMGLDFWNRLPDTFGVDLELIRSRPSIVQVTFSVSALRWFVSHALKFPAHVECALFPRKRWLAWPFVGGWEAMYRRRA